LELVTNCLDFPSGSEFRFAFLKML
jgi:hypothetical protein